MLNWTPQDDLAVKYAKAITADAVEKAGSGHPGAPISLAPVAHLLFHHVMRHDPLDSGWIGRDRFILSGGHASMLLYTQLYYCGYGLELTDLQNLRSFGSLTPGHPEYGHTNGVEMTTGPLGQGLSSAVGMALAARRAAAYYAPDLDPHGTGEIGSFPVNPFTSRVFVVCGDGDLQEGIAQEAASFAGTQKLSNLIVIWDDNQISIEDNTKIAFNEDVLGRFAALGWNTLHVDWRNKPTYTEDVEELYAALNTAQLQNEKPTLIRLSTLMAWPSPTKCGTGAAHGSALGAEEIVGLKEALGLDPTYDFQMDPALLSMLRDRINSRAAEAKQNWQNNFDSWKAANPELFTELQQAANNQLPADFAALLPNWEPGSKQASRSASGQVINAIAKKVPFLIGGSADLGPSNNTYLQGLDSCLPAEQSSAKYAGNFAGRNLHFGVREHAMGAIANGIALHGLHRPYVGTFFVFADYMRGAVRLAALMKLPVIYVWTHDSVGVGEDGPTHQPVEHLWSYRAIPGLNVIRPADSRETALAWHAALLEQHSPSALVLSRQNLPLLAQTAELKVEDLRRGAYILSETPNDLDLQVLLLATGSEVELALNAQTKLAQNGIGARVVSMPCLNWFEQQSDDYRESVLPTMVKARVSVEAGSTLGWYKYVGDYGACVGIDDYGLCASANQAFEMLGLTVDNVVAAAEQSLEAVNSANYKG